MRRLDVKEKNLLIFILKRLVPIIVASVTFTNRMKLWNQPVRFVGFHFLIIMGIRVAYRLFISLKIYLHPRQPSSYGKWAIVTGTTAGIGKAFAFELAARGLNVIIHSRSLDKLEEVRRDILALYPHVEIRCLPYDYSDRAGADGFFRQLEKTAQELEGSLGILVNNVGMVNPVPDYLHVIDEATTHAILQVNVEGTVRTTRAIVPTMIKQKKGAIINVSSGSGNHPTPMITCYASTKSFITEFSQCLSHELREFGIDVMVVTPYYVISNQFKRKAATWIAPTAERMVKDTLPMLGYVDKAYPYWFHAFTGFLTSIYWDVGGSVMEAMRRNSRRIKEQQEAKRAKEGKSL